MPRDERVKKISKVKKEKKPEVTRAQQDLLANRLYAAQAEGFIEKDHEYERTLDIQQLDILENVELETSSKVLNLKLDMGPYHVDVTRDGQFMLVAGAKGQISMIELPTNRVIFDKNLLQTIRGVKPLFNENHFAIIGKKYVSIYDKQCTEIHCFKSEKDPRLMDYLPYHALLSTWGEGGELRWRDVSTGQFVAVHKTLGARHCRALKHNPYTGVVYLGDSSGNVSLWTPNMSKPVLKLHATTTVTALTPFDEFYLAAGGLDNAWKVYDIRKAEKALHFYRTYGSAPVSMEASQTGLVAVGYGSHVEVWKDPHLPECKLPYLKHRYNGRRLESLRFRPFEDILFCGHSEGLSTLLVPGAGISNPDAFSDNPYSSAKSRSDALIRSLLEKLPPESITFKTTT